MTLVNGIITKENLHKICKLCLEEKESNYKLSMIVKFQDCLIRSSSIADLLAKVSTQVKSDNIIKSGFEPEIICYDCFNELKLAYLLILKYEEANSLWNDFLTNYIKDEKETIEEYGECENDFKEASDLDHDYSTHYETRNATKRLELERKQTNKKRNRKRKLKDEEVDSDDDDNEEVDSSYNINILHSCPICTKEFTALELRDHAHTHQALGKYLKIPNEHKVSPTSKFRSNNQTKNISLFNREQKLHKCPYCDLEFPVLEFRVHIDIHRKQTEFHCDKCERVFKKLNHLNTHRVKHLKEFPYKCDQCNKGFVIKRNYDCHILTHTNNELPHECPFCFKRFSNPEHLNRHQIIHTENVTYSIKYRVCKCRHCLRTFKDKDELQRHTCVPVEKNVNTRFPCKTCNKVFKHSSGLYNHNRNIHKLKGTKTLCSVCGNHVSNIYHHMMRHTGEKPFQCNQCEKRFVGKPQLKQHLLVHSGLKPYVCSVCAKAFNNLYNLQVHERIHKGDRCHICPVCNKGFLEKSYLKKHMNIHSKVS